MEPQTLVKRYVCMSLTREICVIVIVNSSLAYAELTITLFLNILFEIHSCKRFTVQLN